MIRRHLSLVTVFFLAIFLASACSSEDEKDKSAKYLASGKSYFDQEVYDKAKIQLMNAVKADPDSIEAHKLLAETYLKTDDSQGAFNEYLRLEQLEPVNVETLTRLAAFFMAGDMRPEAKLRIEKTLKIDPHNIDALYLEAGILALEKQPVENLVAKYQFLLDLDPSQTKAMLTLSRLYMFQSEYAKAEESIKQALALAPEDNRIHMALYFFYISRKDLESAEETLKKLISTKPDDPEPIVLLAGFYADQRLVARAEEYYLKAIEIDPDNVNPRMLLARLYNSDKELDKAEVQIKRPWPLTLKTWMLKMPMQNFTSLTGKINWQRPWWMKSSENGPDFHPPAS